MPESGAGEETDPPAGGLFPRLGRALLVHPGEGHRLRRAALLNFCLLAAYYILRPLREEVGAELRDELTLLWNGTFFAMLAAVPLFSYVVGRLSRRRFVPVVLRFFAANLLVFLVLILVLPPGARIWIDRVFYVWVSVFNLLVVSMFWGFMSDVHDREEAKRLFGAIAVGGTLGAIAGSFVTGRLAGVVSPAALILGSVLLLEVATWIARSLEASVRSRAVAASGPGTGDTADLRLGGGILEGFARVVRSPYLVGICLYLLFYTLASTVAYFEQGHIVGEAIPDRAERRALFANINLFTNLLALLCQLFATGRIVRRIGVGWTLTLLPLFTCLGFIALGSVQVAGDAGAAWAASIPVLWVLVVFQVVRRGSNFALAKPAREVLFTIVSRADRYKSKSFIDTAVYRGGDVTGAWIFAGLTSLGMSLGAIALAAAPLSIAWAGVGLVLGRVLGRATPAKDAAEPGATQG